MWFEESRVRRAVLFKPARSSKSRTLEPVGHGSKSRTLRTGALNFQPTKAQVKWGSNLIYQRQTEDGAILLILSATDK